MKKNEKGFTLIELMGVVIILIIIIFMAISKIGDSTKKAKLSAIRANSISYINLLRDKAGEDVADSGELDTGIFTIGDLRNLGIKLSGKEPDSGYVLLSDFQIVTYCLNYNGYKVTNVEDENNIVKGECSLSAMTSDSSKFSSFEYDYVGNDYYTFKAPVSGIYFVELWGASGYSDALSGKGAYTSGYIYLNKNTNIYIYLGQGNSGAAATFNGGGSCRTWCYPGGGATDIRLVSGSWNNTASLASRIMVAGGGGGYNTYSSQSAGGAAGGLTGNKGLARTVQDGPYGGSQTAGGDKNNTNTGDTVGFNGTFGIGGNAGSYGGGGGGGYYGGAGGSNGPSTGGGETGGGGGSSYISGYTGCVAIKSASNITPKDGCVDGTTDNSCSIHYSGFYFYNPIMKSGNQSMPTYNGKSTMTGNTGNGHAKITVLSNDFSIKTYAYTGHREVFTAPKSGTYLIELWGAQGGAVSNNAYVGGKGAYTSGEITLSQGRKLYIYVGENYNNYKNEMSFNGGGKGSYSTHNEFNANGGGATDVRLVDGDWNDFNSLKSRIMVAAGGGGSNIWSQGANGGAAGALVGRSGIPSGGGSITSPAGGGQTAGGLGYNGTAGTFQGTFGQGGYSQTYSDAWFYHAGGGGGYYGGGGGGASTSVVTSAAGGSSFISGYPGCDAISESSTEQNIIHTGSPDHYSAMKFTNSVMKAGDEEMPNYYGTGFMVGNEGNGYAKITLLG